MTEVPPFVVDNDGCYFVVLVFDNYVVKLPRRRPRDDKKIREMVALQNTLAAQVECVLPIEDMGDYLLMERAPGERCDTVASAEPVLGQHVKSLLAAAQAEIEALSYDMRDCTPRNSFYDRETDRVYLVDFHLVTPAEAKTERKARSVEMRRTQRQERERELAARTRRGR